MGIFTKDIDSLDDLFVHMLQDIYYAEQQMLKALPDMINKATNSQLRSRFEEHLAATRNQVRRLERVFEMHGIEPQTVTCPAINGIIKEANDIAGEANNKEVLDAALIATAQAVEHYEISRYGALISWASLVAGLLAGGTAFAQQPGVTSGPAAGKNVLPSTSIQKGNSADANKGAPAAAGVPGAEAQPGVQSGRSVRVPSAPKQVSPGDEGRR